jgi:D-arabinose 5-phosphate isomerase GutQ
MISAAYRMLGIVADAEVEQLEPQGGSVVKFVVIGGSGLIGKKLVNDLDRLGHEAVAASPSSGVNTLTGEGLAGVLKGADAVVDVSNSPS